MAPLNPNAPLYIRPFFHSAAPPPPSPFCFSPQDQTNNSYYCSPNLLMNCPLHAHPNLSFTPVTYLHMYHHPRFPNNSSQYYYMMPGPLGVPSSDLDQEQATDQEMISNDVVPKFQKKRIKEWKIKGRYSQRKMINPSHDDHKLKLLNKTTTLMIRNIPNKFDKKRILDLLDYHCRKVNENLQAEAEGGDTTPTCSEFDFLYLPMDFSTGCNYGYAFVNFTTPIAAQRFYTELHHKSWESIGSRKVCAVTNARIQGLPALLRHFRNSIFICGNGEYRPVHFTPSRNGLRSTDQQHIGRHICL